MEPYDSTLNASHRAVLKMMSLELANGKRIEELLVLRHLLTEDSWSTAALARKMSETYHFLPSAETMKSVARLLDLQFFTKTAKKKYGSQPLISFENHAYVATPYWNDLKENEEFQRYVRDILIMERIVLKASTFTMNRKSFRALSAMAAILAKTCRAFLIMKRTVKARSMAIRLSAPRVLFCHLRET